MKKISGDIPARMLAREMDSKPDVEFVIAK
jgi:hypothetical protein